MLESELALGPITKKARKDWTLLKTAPTLRYRKGASRIEREKMEQADEEFELLEDEKDEEGEGEGEGGGEGEGASSWAGSNLYMHHDASTRVR